MTAFHEFPILLVLGLLFLAGLAADLLGRTTFIPRVTLLILIGLAAGPSGFNLLPQVLIQEWFPILTTLALTLVGFLLGQKMSVAEIRAHGKLVIGITIGETLGALMLVAVVLMLAGAPPVVALLLAGIAPATAPAATFDVVNEGGFRSPIADTLLAVVAIDDAWGLLLFSLIMALAATIVGDGSSLTNLADGVLEIGGSIALGAILGIPMAYLTGRIQPGEPTLAEAMGFVLLCGGAAQWLGLSPILASMIMGSFVASLAKHHDRPFHAIEGVDWPFLVLFFVLAGASAHVDAVLSVSGITALYLLSRCIGMYSGAWAGARLAGGDERVQKWIGLCLFPQAGVAIGMALMASQRFPDYADILLPSVLASTIIYELVAPAITRRALAAAEA